MMRWQKLCLMVKEILPSSDMALCCRNVLAWLCSRSRAQAFILIIQQLLGVLSLNLNVHFYYTYLHNRLSFFVICYVYSSISMDSNTLDIGLPFQGFDFILPFSIQITATATKTISQSNKENIHTNYTNTGLSFRLKLGSS